MSNKVMPLNQAVNYIQDHKLFLHRDNRIDIDLWTPNTQVPIGLRRSVVKHKQELKGMMDQADIRACPAKTLHKQYYRYAGANRFACDMCKQLDSSQEYLYGQAAERIT